MNHVNNGQVQQSKFSIKKLIAGILALAVFSAVVIFVFYSVWVYINKSFINDTKVTKEIYIVKGQGFGTLYRDLFGGRNDLPIGLDRYLRNIEKLPEKIKYGFYAADNITYRNLLDNIIAGKQSTVKVTVPEGANLFNIALAIENAGVLSKETFLKTVFDPKIAEEITGFKIKSLEGFMFPGTYLFPKKIEPIKVVETMYKEFEKNLPQDFAKKVHDNHGLSVYEAVILASIVQKETYSEEEAPLVASVYYNRLNINMRLQADPTILYGKFLRNKFEIRIDKKDLWDETNNYNTYRFSGLTPTPICNPSKLALDAVADPAKTDYFFFVASKDGKHLFSKDYETHRNYVNEHQKQ